MRRSTRNKLSASQVVPVARTAHSTLRIAEKDQLQELLATLDGHVVNEWTEECTHLTMNDLTVTIKVLRALIAGRPIVNMNFWRDCVLAKREGSAIPDVDGYFPELTEQYFSHNKSYFRANPSRKSLFAGKRFIFVKRANCANFSAVIENSGGTATSLEGNRIKKSELINKNTVLVQYNDGGSSQNASALQNIFAYVRAAGLRTIPESEIGLAVIHCSVTKYCNPNATFSENFDVASDNYSHTVLAVSPEIKRQADVMELSEMHTTPIESIEIEETQEWLSQKRMPTVSVSPTERVEEATEDNFAHPAPAKRRRVDDIFSELRVSDKPDMKPQAPATTAKPQTTNSRKHVASPASDDDEESLFNFKVSNTKKARPNSHTSNVPIQKIEETQTNGHTSTPATMTRCPAPKLELRTDGWMSRYQSIKTEIKTEEQSAISADNQIWINEIKDVFVVVKKPFKFPQPNAIQSHTDDEHPKETNFKAFKKKFNYKKQTVIVRSKQT